MTDTPISSPNLNPAAAGEAQPSPAAAEKPAAEKPAAEKPAAEKPAAEKPAAEKPAAEKPAAEKPARRRRGPPADGKSEKRVLMVLTTSKLSDANGVRLRRGRLVSVPERRIEALLNQGRIRRASAEEVEILKARHGQAELG